MKMEEHSFKKLSSNHFICWESPFTYSTSPHTDSWRQIIITMHAYSGWDRITHTQTHWPKTVEIFLRNAYISSFCLANAPARASHNYNHSISSPKRQQQRKQHKQHHSEYITLSILSNTSIYPHTPYILFSTSFRYLISLSFRFIPFSLCQPHIFAILCAVFTQHPPLHL